MFMVNKCIISTDAGLMVKHPVCNNSLIRPNTVNTRRPASADTTARRQFQATSQLESRTQASDAMTSRLPRWAEVCATQVLPMRVGPFAFRYQGNGAIHHANILISLERQLIALQLCRWEFLYSETLQQTFRPLLSKLVVVIWQYGHTSQSQAFISLIDSSFAY